VTPDAVTPDPGDLHHLAYPEEGLDVGRAWRGGRGRAWRGRRARGRRYARLDPALEARVPEWLAALDVPEGRALKAPDVHQVGALVVKFFTQPSLFGWVRAPRAVRSGERYIWCLPLRSPRPLLAAGETRGPSLLVREHVSGELLKDVWRNDAHAEEALAAFLAGMERHGVVHGDLHPRNLLWTGSDWVLLDVDGLRHRLHDPVRVLTGQWARFVFHLGDEERVRALHARAGALAGGAARVPWESVRRAVAELVARRGGA
jgi:hypothetical protein